MRRLQPMLALTVAALAGAANCSRPEPADVLLVGGRVYTLAWSEPDREGGPARDAPRTPDGWRPDAEAIAIRGGRVAFAGSRAAADRYRGPDTRVVDLKGATAIPGLIDAHVHLANLGASLDRVNLVGVQTEEEAVQRVVARAASVPKGEWIIGWGWDEGAWTSHLPDMKRLSALVPDHPVVLHGLHTFAVWGNKLAFQRAGITRDTPVPAGGEIKKDAKGEPTGILVNNASALLTRAVPPPAPDHLADRVLQAIDALIAHGYTSVHEAGADDALLATLVTLEARGQLKLPVYVMLAARDTALVDAWRQRGPMTSKGQLVVVRSVKAFYDGAMGSRGAYFLQPYNDRPDHVGVGGAEYGFDRDRLAAMMKAGFQIVIHAIGDRANRESLDFFDEVMKDSAAARTTRPRIEHAQVVNPVDRPRFAALGVIASMQPSHAVEDMAWAETRIGSERIKGAYAWRSLRRAGARLTFNSDLPATDYDIFYGLHSAVTRTDPKGQPPGGWRPDERMTIEEAIRGWTTWAAYAEFREQDFGTLAAGKIANITVTDIDPFQIGERDADKLLNGKILLTVVAGKIAHEAK